MAMPMSGHGHGLGNGNGNGMYPPPKRDYHHMPHEPGPSTYHNHHNQNQNHGQAQAQAYNPFPQPGAAFNQNPVMSHPHQMDQQQQQPAHNQNQNQNQNQNHHQMNHYQGPLLTQPVTGVIGPSPDSNITTPTPRSGQNNLDLSGYLDPTDKVEPKLPFFHNNPSIVKSAGEDDGRMSDGEDPGKYPYIWIFRELQLIEQFRC
jgi:hypothetical protein